MTKAIDEAFDVERLRHEAQFLVDRIKELDWCGDIEALARDWNGHVDPPLYRLEKTLAALQPATDERKAVEWQDIATAPKDGRGILVIDMTAETPEAGCAWFLFDRWSCIDPDGEPAFEPEFYHVQTWPSPTHWMPLPAPPERGTHIEGGE